MMERVTMLLGCKTEHRVELHQMTLPQPQRQINPVRPRGTFFLVSSIDPTRTILIRQQFVAEMRRRFARLIADVKEAVVKLDVLALNPPTVRTNAAGLSSRQFDFPRREDKIKAFVDWLGEKEDEYLLSHGYGGIHTIGQLSVDPNEARASWMNTYLDSAYQRGMRRGREELQKLGITVDDGSGAAGSAVQVAFNGPIHADRIGLIYTRAYSSLKSITSEMDSVVSDVLAMGMADGRNPSQIAKMLDKVIRGRGETLDITDSLGRVIDSERRAEILARTEVIRAHHSANIAEYKAAGMMGIKIMAEHLTAGDGRVCPRCAPLNHKLYKISEAEFIIPVHPQCRCVALPHIEETEEETS